MPIFFFLKSITLVLYVNIIPFSVLDGVEMKCMSYVNLQTTITHIVKIITLLNANFTNFTDVNKPALYIRPCRKLSLLTKDKKKKIVYCPQFISIKIEIPHRAQSFTDIYPDEDFHR